MGDAMDDVIIRVIPLPDRTRGLVLDDENGDYNIYVNDSLAYEEQRNTVNHELTHIRRNHLHCDIDVMTAESEISI